MVRVCVMSSPFQILCLSAKVPDLVTSGFGAFVLHDAVSLDDISAQLQQQRFAAIVIELSGALTVERLAQWPGMARAVLESALIVIGPEPTLAMCQKLLTLGVHEVMCSREVASDKSGELLGRVLRVVIERKKRDDAARKAYSIDLTTGLPNHHQLLEHMNHLLALREHEPAAMALIVLHLDGFRAADGSLGAEAANVLRRKAAVRLRASLRASDVVASLGPDMLAVLLAWIDDSDDAQHVARKLLTSVSQPFSVAGQATPVSAKLGVSLYPAHGKTAQELMDRAVAQASGDGMGRVMVGGHAANDDGPTR